MTGRIAFLSGLLVSLGSLSAMAADGRLSLVGRSRSEIPGSNGNYRVETKALDWDATKTAVIICNVWDLHHCLNATRRVGEMAPRMDAVITSLRDRGVLVIHAPSDCMASYEDHPARQRAKSIPKSSHLPVDIGKWCYQIPAEERGKYPIDQTDGGEDDDLAEHARWAARLAALGRNPKAPWKKETDRIGIDADRDLISDKGDEIWSALESKGIDNVILVGVHLNMCVLGRPFGLRQMAKNGKNVVLMRDMTDTMYNPKRSPYVSHFTGTDLIVEHVEKFVCPTVTSDQVLGGSPFRFKADRRPHAVFLIAEDEYQTDQTLPAFAAKQLGRDFRVSFVFADPKDRNTLSSLDALMDADLAFVSMRRRVLPESQVAMIRRFVADGHPIVGIRTASHGLSPKAGEKVPEGYAAWTTFDADVLGGNYANHHPEGSKTTVSAAKEPANDALLRGVDVAGLVGNGSLYKVSPLAATASPLLIGTAADHPAEPVAWTHLSPSGGRVFYTSLGHPDDFAEPAFEALLRNAVYWAAGLDVPAGATGTAEAVR